MYILRKNIRNAVLSTVLAGALAAPGLAGAFGETSTGVQIKEFSLLDTASDIVGAADFTPEGNKDGHFKLTLSLAQNTVIKSVVLRSTDAYGDDNDQGVWRTNRATTGWLLGMVRNKPVTSTNGATTYENEIINPGFQKEVNAPVGEFTGELAFDLYASNNGTIKETQYYVLEIETPQGMVTSKPIKYKQPMTAGGASAPNTGSGLPVPTPTPKPGSGQPTPTPTPTPNPGSGQPAPTPTPPPPVPAEGPTIHVFFKGQELMFDDAKPILKDGSTLVPFRKLFEALGFAVKWVDTGTVQQAIGTKDGLNIELTISSTTAKVNGNNVPLDIPAQIINGSTLVPLRFVAENSGYEVSYSSNGSTATIQIDEGEVVSEPDDPAPNPTPEPAKEEIEPYVVKGYIRDAKGNPVPGVTVYADNTLLYNSNVLGVTDESGHYRIELPQVATSWRMGADLVKSFNGKNYKFRLTADVDQPLAGSAGAVKDFTWTKFDGQIYIYPYLTYDTSLPEFLIGDVEITLTPVGPLLDGNSGKTITKRVGPVLGGLGIDEVPIGKYTATARWLPEGHAPIPMQIRINYIGKYAESAEVEFSEPRSASTNHYLSELEIRIPENK
ncbi:hypothetical protein DVH26_17010 [Paenibacillus sp. H1-7]|uniref:stalk domain-containing protein n=1 Tax=Paenibacillus sp. H1-7 TaxID=2282849 RepID=UPI001EF89717|nr:stalk domain-containing protein [Paenibacillus sp. H1-7]ULL15996.1 hypothetical protein DVH26_17010 [Paenibacillus sp. H1-7]